MLKTLSALPCFTQVTKVTTIRGGLSHDCFKVEADNVYYFAKSITGTQLKNEVLLTQISSTEKLSPNIYYTNEQWIISDYIEGGTLAKSDIPLSEKISMGIALMTKFHHLSITHAERINTQSVSILKITETIDDLNHPNNLPIFFALVKAIGYEIEAVIEKGLDDITESNTCCHSDMNFSNILINDKRKTWLIDFEHACYAPAEFDLAMFIAINTIATNNLDCIINLYEQQSNRVINKRVLHYFLLFSYLINGLWYFNNTVGDTFSCNARESDLMHKLATEQWQAFDILYHKLGMSKDIITLQKFI